MKKLITIILLAVLAIPGFAQKQPEQKWTVKANAGYFPSVPTLVLPFVAVAMGLATANNENEKIDTSLPPYVAVEAQYAFNTRWSIGLEAGYSGSRYVIVYKDTGEVKSSTDLLFFPVMVEGRYNYLCRPIVKLYGSFEGGVILNIQDKVEVVPSGQINPLGVEVGQRFFGMAELGIGMTYFGLRAGIGYRF